MSLPRRPEDLRSVGRPGPRALPCHVRGHGVPAAAPSVTKGGKGTYRAGLSLPHRSQVNE